MVILRCQQPFQPPVLLHVRCKYQLSEQNRSHLGALKKFWPSSSVKGPQVLPFQMDHTLWELLIQVKIPLRGSEHFLPVLLKTKSVTVQYCKQIMISSSIHLPQLSRTISQPISEHLGICVSPAISSALRFTVIPVCIHPSAVLWGFPEGTRGKQLACQCRRCKRCMFDPGLGRSPGKGNGNSFQYSCLGNPMDRGAWWATVRGVAESDTTEVT